MATVQLTSPSSARLRRRKVHGNTATKLLFLAPAAVLFSLVMIVPIVVNFVYAFTDWDGYTRSFNFIGFQNFVRAIGDVDNQRAFINTLIFTVVNAPLQISIGLILALSLKAASRLASTLRTVIVFPIAISGVVVGFVGTIIFDPRSGVLQLLEGIPLLGMLSQNWLGDPSLAMASVIAMNLWQWCGFTMLIFLAGLATIPAELYEAATLDGASAPQQFWNVTWPLLAPAVTINVVLTAIGGLKVFDIIYVLTGGGPGNATQSIVMRVAAQSSFGSYGYSAAISFLLTIVILVVALVLLAFLRRREASA